MTRYIKHIINSSCYPDVSILVSSCTSQFQKNITRVTELKEKKEKFKTRSLHENKYMCGGLHNCNNKNEVLKGKFSYILGMYRLTIRYWLSAEYLTIRYYPGPGKIIDPSNFIFFFKVKY